MCFVAPWHVGSFRIRDSTRVPCTGRRILNHCATREVLCQYFKITSLSIKSHCHFNWTVGTWDGTNRDGLASPHLPPPLASFSGRPVAVSPLLGFRMGMLWVLRAQTSLTQSITLSSNSKLIFPSSAPHLPFLQSSQREGAVGLFFSSPLSRSPLHSSPTLPSTWQLGPGEGKGWHLLAVTITLILSLHLSLFSSETFPPSLRECP